MRLWDVTIGDIVEVNIRGSTFLAEVMAKLTDHPLGFDLQIEPKVRNCSQYHCHANDVSRHWKLQGRPRGRPKQVDPPPVPVAALPEPQQNPVPAGFAEVLDATSPQGDVGKISDGVLRSRPGSKVPTMKRPRPGTKAAAGATKSNPFL
jgi:hypothetical protein